MFDRFIRLARARKALSEGRFEEAVQLAGDPLIRGDRRSEEVRERACDALMRRADGRLQKGDAAAAVRDLEHVASAGRAAAVEIPLAAARARLAADGQQRAAKVVGIDEVRRQIERGALSAAAAQLAGLGDGGDPAIQAVHSFLDSRREQAAAHRRAVETHLAAGQVDQAVTAMRAAAALDVDGAPAALQKALAAAAARRLLDVVRLSLSQGDLLAAIAQYRQRLAALPDLAEHEPVVAIGAELAAAVVARFRAAAVPEAEVELAQAGAAEPPLPGSGAELLLVSRALLRLPGLRTSARPSDLAATLVELARMLDRHDLRAEAELLRRRGAAAEAALERARSLATGGDLGSARAHLVAELQELPMHEELRAELEAIDRGVREREQRLEAARVAAKAGRLGEAYGLVLAHAQPGAGGDDARLFAQDLRARIDLVGRGLDQVRAALHGRTSGGIAGLRHCLLRIEELAKVQSDHEEIPTLRRALTAEIAGIEAVDAAAVALGKGQFPAVSAAIAELVGTRAELLSPDRLDARILELGDRLVAGAEAALAAGRLGEADRCLQGVLAAVSIRPDYQSIVDRIQADANQRREQASELAAAATAAIAARDLTTAERHWEAARQLWLDGPAVRKLEDELQSVRTQEARLQRVEALARDGDVAGAHAEMGGMPPTPALLRTRIFDMKQQLARAQGLEGNFLLRVDEGGEFVALRGETVTIGNLREGSADLSILAAIAQRHARIQRSMSFHGGMQDTIVAEGGAVRIAGAAVDSHRLRSGDRLQLGAALQMAYTVPSKRSLTAALQLLGGFQVAGTDRLLLFKDRGRDGRILIGPGTDVHVRVASARGEVEVFANRNGQICVRCDGGGEIDGRPFREEHPVTAGATVRAAGITFVLLPWHGRS